MMDAYYAVRTNWQDCPAEDEPHLMCMASDTKQLEADHAKLVALVREWADAKVVFDAKRLDEDFAWRERYRRLTTAEDALLQARKELKTAIEHNQSNT